MKTLIRRRVLWRLIWVCTVCLCPKNGTLGLYGLKNFNITQYLWHKDKIIRRFIGQIHAVYLGAQQKRLNIGLLSRMANKWCLKSLKSISLGLMFSSGPIISLSDKHTWIVNLSSKMVNKFPRALNKVPHSLEKFHDNFGRCLTFAYQITGFFVCEMVNDMTHSIISFTKFSRVRKSRGNSH